MGSNLDAKRGSDLSEYQQFSQKDSPTLLVFSEDDAVEDFNFVLKSGSAFYKLEQASFIFDFRKIEPAS